MLFRSPLPPPTLLPPPSLPSPPLPSHSPPTNPSLPPGVAINTLASPVTVFKEVQTITTTLAADATSTPLSGSFALSWRGALTVDLPFNATAQEVKIALQDLPEVGLVTVIRTSAPFGAYVWTVTFDSVPGNVEMIQAYPGRLTPLSHGASMVVAEKVAGSAATMVYDGVAAPEVRTVTVSNLNSDMTFSFKVRGGRVHLLPATSIRKSAVILAVLTCLLLLLLTAFPHRIHF